MTNKLFIVKYAFFDEIDAKIIAIFDINLNRRESFDDTSFEIIFAQNIRFFDVAKNVANNINSMKINKIMKNVENEIKDEVNDDFKNKMISLNKDETIWLNIKIKAKISLDVKISKKVDLDFFW